MSTETQKGFAIGYRVLWKGTHCGRITDISGFDVNVEFEVPYPEDHGSWDWVNVMDLAVIDDRDPTIKVEVETPDDPVNHPRHYTSSPARCSECGHPIECIDVTRHMGFNVGNVVKYLWRFLSKGVPVQDLEKARWYLEDEIAQRKKGI